MYRIDQVVFLESMEKSVDDAVFRRGLRYYQSNLVNSLRILADDEYQDNSRYFRVSGVVRGTQTYKTSIGIKNGTFADYDCTCPYVRDHYNDEPCKHVVALALTLSDRIENGSLMLPKATEFLGDKENGSKRKLVRTKSKIVDSSVPHYEKEKNSLINKKREPFEKRYFLLLKIYEGIFGNIQLVEYSSRSSWYPYGFSDEADLKNNEDLTKEQSEMVNVLLEYRNISYEDREKKRIDITKLFSLAKKLGVDVFVSEGYTKERKINWIEPEKISGELSLLERKSHYGNHSYEVISFILSQELSKDIIAVSANESGVVVVKRSGIEIYDIPILLGRIIERATGGSHGDYQYYYGIQKSQEKRADLLAGEYEHINEIIKICKKSIDCKIKIKEKYVVEYHDPKPVILVDYVSLEKTLLIEPAVDYGVAVLPVADTMSYSVSYKKNEIARKRDEAFGDTHVVRIVHDTIHLAPVSEKIERTLFNLGIKKSDALGIKKSGRLSARGDKQISKVAETYLPEIKKLGYEMRYPHDILDINDADFRADFDIDFNGDKNWLAFDIEMYCGENRVQLEDIEACINSGTNLLKMADGRILRIQNPEAMKRIVEMLVHFRKNDDGKYEGRTYNAPELDAVATGSPYYNAQVSSSFKSFIKEAKGGKIVKTVRIPKQFTNVLRDYQIQGVHWLHFLHHYHFGGVLADDMGLGKTLQALAILSIHAKRDYPSLVVAPKTLLHNWEHEASIFAPHLKVKIIEGSQKERERDIKEAKKYDLIITSYPALQKDIEVYEKYKHTFNYCVIDEAQYIKNPRTKNAHTVRRIASDYRLALTGTPLENGVEEIWSAFDFLMPGFLGHHAHFQKHIGNPIMKQSDTLALARLKTKVQCFMLRRTKEEVLKELPPKIEQVLECDLSDEQNILYQDVLRRVKKDIEKEVKERGFAGSQIHILAGLTRLRQICNHPALVLQPKKRGVYPSAKMDACIDIIEELKSENRKVLVFSQFTKMLDILAKELNERKIKHSYLSGKTKDRKETVNSFIEDSEKTVFLISTKAGGVGLNLTIADAVIIFDPWWNPQVERQAVDRAHRIGQKKSINVYRLRTKGTIEEKIAVLQERKQNLFNALVGDSKDLFKKLTWDDVKSLLT